jgi:predicted transcriptional regulator
MAKSLPVDFLNVFVLYLLNVSQPLQDVDVAGSLRQTPRFSGGNPGAILDGVREALVDLAKQGYVRQNLSGQYYTTYSGIQLLADRKMAFPRDKNRLYFLKEALRRRG